MQNILSAALDYLGGIFPSYGLARVQAQVALEFAREGQEALASKSAVKRGLGNWDPFGEPNENLERDQERDKLRVAELNSENGHAAGMANKMVIKTIGAGRPPQSIVDEDTPGMPDEDTAMKFQNACENGFKMWARHARSNGKTFWSAQQMACRSLMNRGEIFVVRQGKRKTVDFPFRTRMKMIEPTRVKTPVDMHGTARLYNGIVYDRDGNETGFWVKREIDPEGKLESLTDDSENFEYIKAKDRFGRPNLTHFFWEKEIGQRRGVPELKPTLEYFRRLDKTEEAKQVAMWMQACIGLIFTSPNPVQTEAKVRNATPGGAEKTTDPKTGKRLNKFFPGMTWYAGPGESVNAFNPVMNNDGFRDYAEHMIDSVTATLPAPPEVIFGKYGDASYSTVRAMMLDFLEVIVVYMNMLGPGFSQDWFSLVMEELVLDGRLPIDAVTFFENRFWLEQTDWGDPGMGLIDPPNEIEAARNSMEGNLLTLKYWTAKFAPERDWIKVLKQRRREVQMEKEYEIEPIPRPGAGGNAGGSPPSSKAPGEDSKNPQMSANGAARA